MQNWCLGDIQIFPPLKTVGGVKKKNFLNIKYKSHFLALLLLSEIYQLV